MKETPIPSSAETKPTSGLSLRNLANRKNEIEERIRQAIEEARRQRALLD